MIFLAELIWMKAASMTDPGRVRPTSEDSFFADGGMRLRKVGKS